MAHIQKENIQKINELDIEKITLKRGGYNKNKIVLNYDDNNMYVKMNTYSPFGLSTYKDSKKYAIYIEINDDTTTFLNKLKMKIFTLINEDKNLQKMLKMRKFNEDIFNNIFTQFYKEKTDNKYKPLLKLNFTNKWNEQNEKLEELECLFYNKEKKFIGYNKTPQELKELLGKKTKNTLCVQPMFYHVNKSIGITFKIKILKTNESENIVNLTKQLEECLL